MSCLPHLGSTSTSHVLRPTPPTGPSVSKRLARLTDALPAAIDLILVGDSLAAGWPPEMVALAAPGQRIFNFAIPGDRIQNTLWRLSTLPVDHLRPKGALILLGTNNLGDGDEPEAIAAGIQAVIASIWRLWRRPHCILVTIPRRGPGRGFREPDRLHVNALLAQEATACGALDLIDADAAFAGASECQAAATEPDLLHLSLEGYKRLTAALGPLLDRVLSSPVEIQTKI
jgi:lysophospholipase L1-like esterase